MQHWDCRPGHSLCPKVFSPDSMRTAEGRDGCGLSVLSYSPHVQVWKNRVKLEMRREVLLELSCDGGRIVCKMGRSRGHPQWQLGQRSRRGRGWWRAPGLPGSLVKTLGPTTYKLCSLRLLPCLWPPDSSILLSWVLLLPLFRPRATNF